MREIAMGCMYGYPKCGAAGGVESQNWNAGELCSTHYKAIAALYLIPQSASLVDDLAKVHLLLQYNTELCLTALGALNVEMAIAGAGAGADDPRFAKVTPGAPNYLKLSRALEYYEGYCWFPANRALLSGLLTTPGFNKSLKLGFNKDPGAGRAHGEQSHRLQWHVIMRVITNNFQIPIHVAAGWKHSALQLFYHYTQGLGSAVNAWGKAMDSQINKGWGNPDKVMADILNSELSLVREAVTRRITKMGGPDPQNPKPGVPVNSARDKAMQTSMFELINTGRIRLPAGENPTTFFDKLVLQIYTWEKTSTPMFPSGDLQKAAKKVLEDARGKAPDLFQADSTYKVVDTNLLAKKYAPQRLVEIDAALVARSRGGFNRDYCFSVQGASPTNPSKW